MEIRLIKQADIDKTKWNSCVHFAPNGNIFGYKWYLDNVAKDWDGLVEGDYESVFPLIHTEESPPTPSSRFSFANLRKWSLFQGKNRPQEPPGEKVILHQPELIRTAGLYSIHVPSAKRIRSFLEAIPEQYRQQAFSLGEGIKPPSDLGYTLSEQQNYMLLLEEPYETLSSRYSLTLQQQLERAHLAQLLPNSNLKPERLTEFYLQVSQEPLAVKTQKSHALLRIMYNALHRGWGFVSGIVGRQQELLAVNFFLVSHKRLVSLLPVESKAGAQVGALAYLFDLQMRTQAERPLLLDFNVREKNEFAESFGGRALPYFHLSRG